MTITPRELLDTSIAQLQTLAAFLGEQLGDDNGRGESARSDAHLCGEILVSLDALIRRVQVASAA